MTASDDIRRGALEERIRLAEQDIAELQQQVDEGELDEATAASLEARYREDLDEARTALGGVPKAPKKPQQAKPRKPSTAAQTTSDTKRTAWIIGVAAAGLLVVIVAIVVLATGGDDQPMSTDQMPGAQAGSVAELEAAVAAQPENNAMRLALANTYFDDGLFIDAMNQYSTVAASDPTPQEASIAAARIGWLAFLRLEDTETALTFLDTAINADPDNHEAVLWTGMVLLYGREDGAAAIPYFEQILALDALSATTRSDVQTMLDEALGGSGG